MPCARFAMRMLTGPEEKRGADGVEEIASERCRCKREASGGEEGRREGSAVRGMNE